MRIDIGKYIETMGTGTINGGANVIDNVNVSVNRDVNVNDIVNVN
jgi:hypothetical protein